MRQAAGTETPGLSLVAVGGYGRAELCPRSDIDVMLVHDRRVDVGEIAERLWYPVWEQELHLGHSVCTVRDALGLGADDLDTATALLSARLVAGDPAPVAELAAGALERWRRRPRQVLSQLADRVERRHEKAGEVAFRSEPDLKEGRGGLRDVHALRWAEAARPILFEGDADVLRRCVRHAPGCEGRAPAPDGSADERVGVGAPGGRRGRVGHVGRGRADGSSRGGGPHHRVDERRCVAAGLRLDAWIVWSQGIQGSASPRPGCGRRGRRWSWTTVPPPTTRRSCSAPRRPRPAWAPSSNAGRSNVSPRRPRRGWSHGPTRPVSD